MKNRMFALVLVCLFAVPCSAVEVNLAIDPDKVVSEIDRKIYGHFLEHIFHSVNGGLWGELIWNRSFEQNELGQWMLEGKTITQESMATNVRLTFGDPAWRDYEYTLEARKTGGQEGFLILFRVRSEEDFYWCNLGGWNNTRHAIERGNKDRGRWGVVGPYRQGRIEADKWYKIRIRCEGPKFNIWLGDEKIIDFTDGEDAHLSGSAGIGTWATQAEFRNFKVQSLDGEVLYEGLPENFTRRNTAKFWQICGHAEAYLDRTEPLNARVSQKIVTGENGGGLQQKGLCIRKGETYEGSVWLKGNVPYGMIARLNGDDRQETKKALKGPSSEWNEYEFTLKPKWSSDNASLCIAAKGAGEFWIDQVSLMPKSWRKKGGFRPDLLKAVADLKPPIIRWPGGCFASSYQWKDGIGPQHKRLPHPREIWDDLDVYSFGTDEFVAMCRAVGAEPLIVVNIGSRNWNTDAETHDYTQDILDWIEYCNGPADSKWGKVRAANGNRKPYNVKYWEIDNETWHIPAPEYAEEVLRLAPLMKKADPSIVLLACGSGGMGRNNNNGMPYNRTVVEECAGVLDYISIHHYENPNRFAEGPRDYEAFFRELGDIIKSSANPDLKIYVSEWNAQSTDWRTGLYCTGLLNAFERSSDILTMGGPALFLRHVSANSWDNAFINFDNRTWFPAPNYVVMKLWNDNYAPLRLELSGDTAPLNAVAAKSENGKTLYYKAVNPTEDAIDVTLNIASPFKIRKAKMQLVTAESLRSRNTLDQPRRIRPVPGEVESDGQSVHFKMPAYSAAVVSACLFLQDAGKQTGRSSRPV
ncbi:MAG: alpha-L-arabinofuranosidase C-terminal domain-containing protein [Planctomycetota bacterium]